jgi:hypothetical protein
MFLNHPANAYRDQEFKYLLLLAEVTEVRCGTGDRRPLAGRSTGGATMRRCLGSALVAFRQRLQSAAPVGHSGTATAGSGASS